VIRGRRFWGDHTPVAGQQFDYAFDDTCPVRETCRSHRNAAALRPALAWSPARESLSHGVNNRQTTLAGGDQTGGNQRSSTYISDFLNRYSSRTVPATFDVLGLATATSAVSLELNDTTTYTDAYRKGEYFRKELSDANISAAKWSKVEVMVSGATTVTGNVWVPQTPEAYTYDDDGNTLTDGRWTYTWDAENRLVRLVARTAVGPQQRIDFEYDHQSRRIRKKVWNNTAGTGSPAVDLKFIYDGWNLIAEVSSADALVRQYMWGTDLSGSFQGAGGVGGLVKIYDHASSKHYFPGYDGNGNVAVLVDGDTGAAGAVYEYGPFGELIRSSGAYAATCPFRFSTKYQDKETDLLYYGYRYYNPSTGRWINRDPIGEEGGENVFNFVGNSPVNATDVLGLASFYFEVIVGTPLLMAFSDEWAQPLYAGWGSTSQGINWANSSVYLSNRPHSFYDRFYKPHNFCNSVAWVPKTTAIDPESGGTTGLVGDSGTILLIAKNQSNCDEVITIQGTYEAKAFGEGPGHGRDGIYATINLLHQYKINSVDDAKYKVQASRSSPYIVKKAPFQKKLIVPKNSEVIALVLHVYLNLPQTDGKPVTQAWAEAAFSDVTWSEANK
jgi:RHS repeat-associated protein